MKMSHNTALAKLSLAGISMAKRNKREAQMYLSEASKDDKNGLLTDQIKMMKDQLTQMDKQVVKADIANFNLWSKDFWTKDKIADGGCLEDKEEDRKRNKKIKGTRYRVPFIFRQ
jgi:hypothetical protein